MLDIYLRNFAFVYLCRVWNLLYFNLWHLFYNPYAYSSYIIQTLQGIGEGAIVLGQLLGYDDEYERHAVLEAGLAVRGLDFANELVSLTEEALDGFMTVQQKGGQVVDLQLVKCVEMIDERIKIFIEKEEEKNNSFE
jgi:hypothetical protein